MSPTRVGYGLVIALYLLSFPYHPGLRSPNELCRLYMSRALVDHGKLSINEVLQQLGGVGDLSCTLTVPIDGKDTLFPCVGAPPPAQPTAVHYYSSKAPLLSFLGAPVYWALKLFGPVTELGQVFFSRLFVTVIPSLLFLLLLRRFLEAYVEEPLADVVVITYALGTMSFAYAESFMSHQLTAVLAFSCFFAAWKSLRGEWKAWGFALAGLLAGLTVLCEYTGALSIVCIAAWVVFACWKQWKKLGTAVALVVAGSALPLAALMAYHQACFGAPLQSGYKFLNDAAYQHWHVGGFLGIGLPDATALGLSFFSPLRGLFTLAPFLMVMAVGLIPLWKKDRALAGGAIFMALANAYFTAGFAYDSWGWTVGPRHLTPWVPFLLLPVALGLEHLKSRVPAYSVALGLCVSSVLVSGLAAFVAYVPPECSTAPFGLALPLMSKGFWPVSWLPVIGLTNPASGMVLLVLLLAIAAFVGWRAKSVGAALVPLLIAIALHLGALKLLTDPTKDVSAMNVLGGAWLGKAGERFHFFP